MRRRSLPCVGLLLASACSSSKAGPAASQDAGVDARPDASDSGAALPWQAPFDPNPRGPFPPGFLWGSSTAAFQIEGGIHDTDWWDFLPHHIAGNGDPDDGPRSRQFYLDDIDVLVSSHQNAYRFGIEWARLFPSASAWATCRAAYAPGATFPLATCRSAASADDLAYYHALLDALASHGITPLVTLVHSSLPSYIDDITANWHTEAWESPEIETDLGAWAGFAASEFGSRVKLWLTLNEPLDNLEGGYIDDSNPPGLMNELNGFTKAFGTMVHAHAAMYDAIHEAEPAAKVSIAQDVHLYYPEDPGRALDRSSAKAYSDLGNAAFLNAIVYGDLDANYDGVLEPGEPHGDPTLKGRADFVGVNYYSFSIAHGIAGYPIVGGVTLPDTGKHGLPKTDRGWDVYPRGIGEAIDFAASYGVPVIVTENGIADHTDANRPRFLAEHLAEVAAKIHAGVKVLGYFHWSTMDNFNWTSGFCPRYGLAAVDTTSPMRTRTLRPSGKVYGEIIQANEVTDALLAKLAPYTAPTEYCPPGP